MILFLQIFQIQSEFNDLYTNRFCGLEKTSRSSFIEVSIWKSFQKSVKAKSVKAQINRVGSAPDGTVLLDFKITSNDPKEFPPGWIWLTENGKVRPIHALYLSGTKSSRLSPITGVITLRKADFSGGHDVHIEIRDAEKIAIQIPKAVLWK